MQENVMSKTTRIVGYCAIVVGIICAFISGYLFPTTTYSALDGFQTTFNWGVALLVALGGVISGILFLAVSEIIKLLQICADKLDKISASLDNGTHHHSKDNMLRDIESNLPKI